MPSRSGLVLIVTHSRDDHAARLEQVLDARGAAWARLDTDRYAADQRIVRFAAGPHGAGPLLRLDGEEVPGSAVGAVLHRHLFLPTAPGVEDPDARAMAESELLASLRGGLLALPAFWLNHPHADALARHKLLQLALAAAEGLAVPETRVTSDPAEIRACFAAWDGRMIAKLAGGQLPFAAGEQAHLVMTARLEAADLEHDGPLAVCPALYQRLVDKACDVRATVVGDRVLACRIDGGAGADWREAGLAQVTLSSYELDDATAARCVALTRRLGLEFAGIDLLRTPDGDHVFLELNAAGQWQWVQEATGLPIAEAIVDRALEGMAARGAVAA